MNVQGTQYQTQDGSKIEVSPDSQGVIHMTAQCDLHPSQGKKSCDYLVPTKSHQKTQVTKKATPQKSPESLELEL